MKNGVSNFSDDGYVKHDAYVHDENNNRVFNQGKNFCDFEGQIQKFAVPGQKEIRNFTAKFPISRQFHCKNCKILGEHITLNQFQLLLHTIMNPTRCCYDSHLLLWKDPLTTHYDYCLFYEAISAYLPEVVFNLPLKIKYKPS